jgi:hypothetical protein
MSTEAAMPTLLVALELPVDGQRRCERRSAVSAQGVDLAERFEQANDELIASIASCTEEQWQATCPDTGWSIAVQAHHLAELRGPTIDWVGGIARGEDVPVLPMAAIDAANARHLREATGCQRDPVVAQLRESGAAVTQLLCSLGDQQLARTGQIVAELPAQSAAAWAEYLFVGEVERHGSAIKQALGR